METPFDPAVHQHADGNYEAALKTRFAELKELPDTSPRVPGLYGTVAFSMERLSCSSAPLDEDPHIDANKRAALRVSAEHYADLATLGASTWSFRVPNASEDDRQVFEGERPSVYVNVLKVYARGAARARLARSQQEAAALQSKAADARLQARAGLKAQRRLPRAHQWKINSSATEAMVEAVSATGVYRRRELLFAFGRAAGSVVLGAMSESPWLAHHTSKRGVIERFRRDKWKAVRRGVAAMVVVGLTAVDRPAALDKRDQLMLRAV